VQQRLAPHADYFAVNVSSPNTPDLRDLQAPKQLRALLDALVDAGQGLGPARPIFVKLAPDLLPGEMEAVVEAVLATRAKGLILANTTLSRDRLAASSELASEAGGLSGGPLLTWTRGLVRRARSLVGDRLAIIASGGIGSGQDAATLIGAGADLVQLWTGLVYAGPGLVGDATKAVRPPLSGLIR
jgi:dihydroorotate dehydrogenase